MDYICLGSQSMIEQRSKLYVIKFFLYSEPPHKIWLVLWLTTCILVYYFYNYLATM